MAPTEWSGWNVSLRLAVAPAWPAKPVDVAQPATRRRRARTPLVHNAKTEMLEAGRYIDALQVTIVDVVSPLWLGEILVAANPRRAMLPP